MKIVVICGMSDEKARARLLPLVKLKAVDQIILIRRSALEMEKVMVLSPPKLMRWSLLLSEIYRFLMLFAACIKHKPACVYAIYFVPHGIYAALIGSLLNIPVIQELIGTDRPKVAHSKWYQKLLSQAEYIGVRGSESLESLSSLDIPREKFFISNAVNVLDFDLFKPDQASKKFDLIYCGYLDQNKQINLLIDAVNDYNRKTRHCIKVGLVGDGPQRDCLERQAADLGLSDHIDFVGRQPYQAISAFLNQSRLFVMTSAFEGLPVAMLEALSCELPVIVPNVGDISDVARHGYNAWLINETSREAYVRAFSEILDNAETYERLVDGAKATRQRFLAEYTLEKSMDTWKAMLDFD